MRSYAAAYKMCGDVSSAESQRDGPIALCWPTRSLTTAISCMGREPVLPQKAGVSSYKSADEISHESAPLVIPYFRTRRFLTIVSLSLSPNKMDEAKV